MFEAMEFMLLETLSLSKAACQKAGQQCTETPEAESNFGYPGALEELLVVSVQFEGLLKVEVGGGQRDGEVHPSHIRQDGIFRQSLQSNARVLGRNAGRINFTFAF